MYAVLQETNGKEYESWLYFIRHTGNEEALQYLHDQLETVDWYILDDLSTFDLDLDNLVSEQTASDMITLNLNHVSNHRKFDGKMEKIDLGLKDGYTNDKKIVKVFKKLGIGHIDEYIEDEDVFVHDMGSDEEDDESSGTEYEYDISDDSTEEESEDEKPKKGSTIEKLKEEIKKKKEQKERERIEREKEIERQREADKKREKERKEKERKEKDKKKR